MSASTRTTALTDLTAPLLRRTAVLPNESLASLLERLTQLNFYPDSRLIRTLGRERLAALNLEDDLAQPTRLETFQQLACLTGLALDELYGTSDHRFAAGEFPLGQRSQPMPWLQNTTRARLEPRWAYDHLRPRDATPFCPRCLQAAVYQRVNWIPCAAAICLEHLCLLIDRCPHCGKRTTLAELMNHSCRNCQTDLRQARQLSVANDEPGVQSQRIIQAWFNVAGPPTEVLEACQLPAQPPPVLYELLHRLSGALLLGQAEWASLPAPLTGLANSIAAAIDQRHRFTPAQAYFLYRSAFAGLLDWPEGFHRWLDAYGGWDLTATQPPVRLPCLFRVQHDWLTSDGADSPLAMVQHELLDYVLKRDLPLVPDVLNHLQDTPGFIERTGILWTEDHTAQCLNLSRTDLRRFYPSGSLADCYWPSSPPDWPQFKQAAVLTIKRRWTIGWSLKDTSSWLGLTTADVLRLVELGLLSMTDERARDDDHGLFNRQAVQDFFDQIVARLQYRPHPRRDLLPLSKAVAAGCGRGVDTAILLQCVLTDQLPAYRRHQNLETLSRLYFIQVTLVNLPARVYATRGWVAGEQFAAEYDFAPSLIRDWLAAGLIKPTRSFGAYHYFDHQQLKELAAQQGFRGPVAPHRRQRRTQT